MVLTLYVFKQQTDVTVDEGMDDDDQSAACVGKRLSDPPYFACPPLRIFVN